MSFVMLKCFISAPSLIMMCLALTALITTNQQSSVYVAPLRILGLTEYTFFKASMNNSLFKTPSATPYIAVNIFEQDTTLELFNFSFSMIPPFGTVEMSRSFNVTFGIVSIFFFSVFPEDDRVAVVAGKGWTTVDAAGEELFE